MRQPLRAEAQGFSVIELLITLLIIGVAAAIAAPNLTRAMQTYRLSSGAQQVADAFQSAKFAAVRTNSTQSVFFNSTTNAVAVGQTTAATASVLPAGVRFTTLTVTAPSIISTAAGNAASISGQQSDSTVALSFPTVTGQTNFRQAGFTSRGLPGTTTGQTLTPGAVNWVYLTNSQGELAAVSITSAGSVRVWRYNAFTSQWN